MSGVALLFPGQGAQYVGMGRDLAEDDGSVRELYERADDTLGMPLSRICWEGPEEELRATENAQPAIMLHSFAIWHLIAAARREGRHRSGTFARGAVGVPRVRRFRLRGRPPDRARARTVDGGLGRGPAGHDGRRTRVGRTQAVADVCERAGAAGGIAVPANLNAPGQVVISGDLDAVAAAGRLASEAGARRVLPLNVSGAFHSPLMATAAEGLAAALEGRGLARPVVSRRLQRHGDTRDGLRGSAANPHPATHVGPSGGWRGSTASARRQRRAGSRSDPATCSRASPAASIEVCA